MSDVGIPHCKVAQDCLDSFNCIIGRVSFTDTALNSLSFLLCLEQAIRSATLFL